MTWETVLSALTKRPGVTMFLGASDTGKTTALRAAAVHLSRAGLLPLAIVDADIGQSTIGPPTTVGLTFVETADAPALSTDARLPCHAMLFVGALSPPGHLLQLIVATKRLVDKALRQGARAVLVDTTGLVGGNLGFQLKLHKVELIEPRHVVALHRGELEDLLSVLHDRSGLTVHQLEVSYRARTRSVGERYRYRASRFASYFRRARRLQLETKKLAILSPPTGLAKLTPEPVPPVISLSSFRWQGLRRCLVALSDASDETLALGLLDGVTRRGEKMAVLTPLKNYTQVRVVRLTNIRLAKSGEELDRAQGVVERKNQRSLLAFEPSEKKGSEVI